MIRLPRPPDAYHVGVRWSYIAMFLVNRWVKRGVGMEYVLLVKCSEKLFWTVEDTRLVEKEGDYLHYNTCLKRSQYITAKLKLTRCPITYGPFVDILLHVYQLTVHASYTRKC